MEENPKMDFRISNLHVGHKVFQSYGYRVRIDYVTWVRKICLRILFWIPPT